MSSSIVDCLVVVEYSLFQSYNERQVISLGLKVKPSGKAEFLQTSPLAARRTSIFKGILYTYTVFFRISRQKIVCLCYTHTHTHTLITAWHAHCAGGDMRLKKKDFTGVRSCGRVWVVKWILHCSYEGVKNNFVPFVTWLVDLDNNIQNDFQVCILIAFH